MRYAIIESGGKQYKAVEGQTIEVDRLSDKAGTKVDLRALLMADGEEFMIGTPTVGGIEVKATVLNHIRGQKAVRFKYSPKKRIRVRGGHRQQYTQLTIDFIGRPGEKRTVEEAEAPAMRREEPEVKVQKSEKAPEKAAMNQPAKKSTEKKAPAKKAAAKSTSKSATKQSSK
jgi:large subunit ribosomal protein L21